MPALKEFIAKVKASGGTAHLLGLLSPGGVHSHQDQIAALARILAEAGLKVAVHAFLDGRDTPPQIGARLSQAVPGRYRRRTATSASPRSAGAITRWTATSAGTGSRKPIALLHSDPGRPGHGAERGSIPSAINAVEAAYARGESDEFVLPTAIGDYAGMRDGDGLLFANFRADRVREIAGALLDPGFLRLCPRQAHRISPPRSA